MNLEEQLDDMAVKASEDAANLHSLQIQVDTLDEGKKYKQTSPTTANFSFRLHVLYMYCSVCFLVK